MTPPSHLLLDPALDPASWDRLRTLIATRGPYGTYVEGPLMSGFAAGLVRRHDALLHDLEVKAASGAMPDMAETSARGNLFRGVLAGEHTPPDDVVRALHGHAALRDAAHRISGRPYVEPTMLYVNLMLPGQELFTHSDTPEFVGLSKETAPEWLLVVMHHSGLFEDQRIAIAGGVIFVEALAEGGAFRCWPEGADAPSVDVQPSPNTAIWLDADRVFHRVDRVGGHDAPAPPAQPDMVLVWTPDGWRLQRGDEVVAHYAHADVRTSVQWKARCFADEAAWAAAQRAPAMRIEDVVARLVEDLRERGILGGVDQPSEIELALLMMRTYIPFPEA